MGQLHDDDGLVPGGEAQPAPGILAVLENRRPSLTVWHHLDKREFFVCEAFVGDHVDDQEHVHGEAQILARLPDSQEGLDAARTLAAAWEMQESLRREGAILRNFVCGLNLPGPVRVSLLEIANRLSADSELPDQVAINPCNH